MVGVWLQDLNLGSATEQRMCGLRGILCKGALALLFLNPQTMEKIPNPRDEVDHATGLPLHFLKASDSDIRWNILGPVTLKRTSRLFCSHAKSQQLLWAGIMNRRRCLVGRHQSLGLLLTPV